MAGEPKELLEEKDKWEKARRIWLDGMRNEKGEECIYILELFLN